MWNRPLVPAYRQTQKKVIAKHIDLVGESLYHRYQVVNIFFDNNTNLTSRLVYEKEKEVLSGVAYIEKDEASFASEDEKEERKDEVAGSQTVPFGMLEHLKRFTRTIVDQNHTCNRDAAENVEREKSLFRIHCGKRKNNIVA